LPIYEYRCDSCGHELDALQKLSDAPLRDCPDCNAAALRRLISAPAFRLKGQGWYETDFKSDKETKRNLAETTGSKDSKDSQSTSAKDAPKSDAKPKADKPAAKKESGATKE
jgi:putative FmdB family regulatory protein